MNIIDILFAKKLGGGSPFPPVIKRVTGNPVEFSDGASAPLVKCVTQITGSQDLHGQTHPWVGGAGKNLVDESTLDMRDVTGTSVYRAGLAPVELAPGDYTISYASKSESLGLYVTIIDDNYSSSQITQSPFTFTLSATKNVMIRSSAGAVNAWDVVDLMLEAGTVATSYEPYSNICPITAYTEGEIEVRGKNLLDPNSSVTYGSGSSSCSVSGDNINVQASGQYTGIVFDKVLPNGTYSISFSFKFNSSGKASVTIVDSDNTTSLWTTGEFISDTTRSGTFTVTNGIAHIRFYCTRDNYTGNVTISNLMLNNGSVVENYEPYTSTTHTTTYPSAIYRGSEDVVNGTATTEWGMIASYAGETLPGQWISDRDEYAPGTTPTTGAQVAYELATPTTSSVTPTNLPIKSLSGYNHIESSTGDMVVDYITEGYQNFVDTVESALPNTRKGGVKAFDIFKTLDEPKTPEASVEEKQEEEVLKK